MESAVLTFVICAYRESAYLEECVQSLKNQTVPCHLLMSTSTPNEHICGIAQKYEIPLYINKGEAGISGDWNFGYSCATSKYITIAHQDDVYEPTYAEKILHAAEKSKHPILIFSDYYEIRNGEKVQSNRLLRIKRIMNTMFVAFSGSIFMRRKVLSFGNSICCPAVTYCASACRDFKFDTKLKFCCDWDAWERLSVRKGRFVYVREPLMGHRIHEGSTTTQMTEGTGRIEEEYMMFLRFWNEKTAKKLSGYYRESSNSNQLKGES